MKIIMSKGWIKLWRKLRENPFMKKPAYRAVWIELLFEAEHGMIYDNGNWRKRKESELRSIIWKGKQQKLKPGQLTCGAYQLGKWTGIPRGTVERILKTFENEEQIEVESSNQFSLITVKKWEEYQMDEEVNEERVRNERGTGEERVRTPKELKELKNEKEKGFFKKEKFKTTWADYEAMRKKLRKPMTDRAMELALSKLEKLSNGDVDIAIAILEQSILNSWQGIFPLREEMKTSWPEKILKYINKTKKTKLNGYSLRVIAVEIDSFEGEQEELYSPQTIKFLADKDTQKIICQ